MNVSRRLGAWRLVAMLVVGCALIATGAFAQTQRLRVKIGPANVYERPRTDSDVFMVAPEGTVLDVLGREGEWYWVLLPADGNGQRRAGYVAVYLVELISPKGPDVVPRTQPGLATKPPVPKPSGATGNHAARVFAGIGFGGQAAITPYGDSGSFAYPTDSTTQYTATYTSSRASAFDATAGIRLSSRFGIGVGFWQSTSPATASVSASVPHPFDYTAASRATSGAAGVTRLERDGHVQLTVFMPLSRRAELAIFGGPSIFYVRQDMVYSLAFNEVYPFIAAPISKYYWDTKARRAFGGNVGADLTIMVWRYFGVGIGGRYARGSLTMPSGDGTRTIKLQVGGPQIGGGLRMRF